MHISHFNVNIDINHVFIVQQKGIEIWARPILPVYKGKYSYAIVFLNRRTDGTPSEVSLCNMKFKSNKIISLTWHAIVTTD